MARTLRLLIPYDVADDKRRRKVEKILSEYGVRVNYSVFEVEIPAAGFDDLIEALVDASDKKEDHIRIYRLDDLSVAQSFVLHTGKGVFEDEPLYL